MDHEGRPLVSQQQLSRGGYVVLEGRRAGKVVLKKKHHLDKVFMPSRGRALDAALIAAGWRLHNDYVLATGHSRVAQIDGTGGATDRAVRSYEPADQQ